MNNLLLCSVKVIFHKPVTVCDMTAITRTLPLFLLPPSHNLKIYAKIINFLIIFAASSMGCGVL